MNAPLHAPASEPLQSMPYQEYLQTEHWQAVSAQAKRQAGTRCQLCNSIRRLHTHHHTYENLGHEQPGDLIVLCDECHGKHHDKLPPPPVSPVVPAGMQGVSARVDAIIECFEQITELPWSYGMPRGFRRLLREVEVHGTEALRKWAEPYRGMGPAFVPDNAEAVQHYLYAATDGLRRPWAL